MQLKKTENQGVDSSILSWATIFQVLGTTLLLSAIAPEAPRKQAARIRRLPSPPRPHPGGRLELLLVKFSRFSAFSCAGKWMVNRQLQPTVRQQAPL